MNSQEQEFGRDYWKTQSTIWLIMMLFTILDLKTRQVDYMQATCRYILVIQSSLKFHKAASSMSKTTCNNMMIQSSMMSTITFV